MRKYLHNLGVGKKDFLKQLTENDKHKRKKNY